MSIEQQIQPADRAPKQTKLNSRWRKGAVRFSTKTTVEHTRFTRMPDGSRRREQDSPTEAKYVERMHAAPGWRNGARITKRGN
jgi:hypothetical protein